MQAEAAALSGSRERIAEVLAFTKASPFVGPAIDAWTSFLSGALAALDGEIDDAAVQFTQAIDGLKKIAPRINIATAQLAAALLVGDRHPMAFTAAGEVESFIADSGYELLRSHFGDALSALRPDVA